MTTRRDRERREVKYTDSKDWADKQGKGFEPTAVKLPDGVTFFVMKNTGSYEIDVVPYIVGVGNPAADEGYAHFERTYQVHRGLGADGKRSYCCLANTFGKRCPVCDWLRKEGGNADPDLVKKLRAQIRMLWCVIDRKTQDKKIQVYDSAYFKSFGEMLKTKIQAVPRYRDFYKLENGYTLYLTVAEQNMGNVKFNGVTNIEMEKREDSYPDDLLDKSPCLDECLIELTYKELNKVFTMEPDDGEEEKTISFNSQNEESTTQTREENGESHRESSAEFQAGDTVLYKRNRYTIFEVKLDGSLSLKNGEGRKLTGIEAEECTLAEAIPERNAPAGDEKKATSSTTSRASNKPSDPKPHDLASEDWDKLPEMPKKKR